MLGDISLSKKNWIAKTIDKMDLRDKIAQVLCWKIDSDFSDDRIKRTLEEIPAGSVFMAHEDGERYRHVTELIKGRTDIPVIVTADLVNGAGCRIHNDKDATLFPWQMACGAADSEELLEEMGRATALEGRDFGVHWTLGPIVDLSVHPDNSMMGIRTFGEKPEHVLRMSKAFVRGVQFNNCMAATAKHFPGDGIDDRDSHVCTSLNSLGREEWQESYGRIWKEMIDFGVMAVMAGHIGLPFMYPGVKAHLGPPPATLSKKIQIDLLRKELGFEGLVISDAYVMAGFCSHAPASDRAAGNIESGSDMYLFANPYEDSRWMLDAVEKGTLTEERLTDAARRVLELKARVRGLLDEEEVPVPSEAERQKHRASAREVARNSISVVRDAENDLPVDLKAGSKVLTVSVNFQSGLRGKFEDLFVVDQELKNRELRVDHVVNPGGQKLAQMAGDYEAVFVNLHVPPKYGSIKMDSAFASNFWHSFWLGHPCAIFTSFGDPYKIYEMPSVPNMINVYSDTADSQRAAVKVWFGEEKARGKSPLKLEGFFDIEV